MERWIKQLYVAIVKEHEQFNDIAIIININICARIKSSVKAAKPRLVSAGPTSDGYKSMSVQDFINNLKNQNNV